MQPQMTAAPATDDKRCHDLTAASDPVRGGEGMDNIKQGVV